MPPRRSVGAKKKAVKTIRPGRKSAAAAAAAAEETPAPEAAAETLASEAPAATDAAAGETASAADEVTRASPAPEEITPRAPENPTVGTPAAIEPAAASETTAAMEVDATGTPTPEVAPRAAETPALETLAQAVETVANETNTVMEEDKVTAGCPTPVIITQAAGSEAQPADPVPEAGAAEGGEARVVEAAGTDEAATGVAEVAPAVKKITKRVRRVVTRRVPVKRTPNKKEPQPDAGKEDKGVEETVLPAMEREQSPNGAEPLSVSIKEGNSTGADAVSMSVEGQNPNGAEAVPMSVEGENPSGAEAVSDSVEEQNPLPSANQPSAPEEPSPQVKVASSAAPASADGASPVVVSRKRVRKVKKIVVVKRPVKAKGVSQKEEKMEEADGGAVEKVADAETDGGAVEKVADAEADGGAVEKVASPGNDDNTNEPSKNDKLDSEAEAASVPDLKTEEDIDPEPRKDDIEKGESNRSVDAEQDKVEGAGACDGSAADQMTGMSERQKRRKTEIFIGGLDRNATEDDIKKVFEKVGEIVEVRMMMDKKTGKNKGYAFLRYATPAQAKQAVTEFSKVEVCGKQCGAAALEGNDTIFLGNIDKKWNKDDVTEILLEIGIEKIDTVTLMPDPKNPECNRGFAFLDFETNKDAQTAFKRLQKKDAFGKGRNIKVAWAEPLADPDEEEMQKVKSVFAEGIPSSWDEKKVREHFKRFGQIERVVLSRNMHSAKRKDFAFVNFTTREAALSCIESFDKESTNNGSKVNVKVSLAKPVQKNKQNKAGMKSSVKDSAKVKPKAVQRETKVTIPVNSQSARGAHGNIREDKSSTTRELLHVLREQAAWKPHGYPRGPAIPDYNSDLHGRKRPLSAVGDNVPYADPRGYPRARVDSAYPVSAPRLLQGENAHVDSAYPVAGPRVLQGDNTRLDSAYSVAGPSYSSLSHSMAPTSLEYYQQSNVRYGTGSVYGAVDASRTYQVRPGNAPYGSGRESRCKCRIGMEVALDFALSLVTMCPPTLMRYRTAY